MPVLHKGLCTSIMSHCVTTVSTLWSSLNLRLPKISLSIQNRWSSFGNEFHRYKHNQGGVFSYGIKCYLNLFSGQHKKNLSQTKYYHHFSCSNLQFIDFCFMYTYIFIVIILIITTATTIYCIFDINMELQTRTRRASITDKTKYPALHKDHPLLMLAFTHTHSFVNNLR